MQSVHWRPLSAVLPIAMTLFALGLVLGHVAVYGVTREADEGAAAHAWQLLMLGQVPFVMVFLFKWVRQSPRRFLPWLAVMGVLWARSLATLRFMT